MTRTPAPIALFVYNRPMHTQRTVEALLRNEGAAESDLFVFSDAAKNMNASPAVDEVRGYVRGIRGFRSVSVIERDVNFGLARSIIGGVTQLCGSHGSAIVLEDDLLTSPYFLNYMNEALELYRDTDQVMHISGSTYPVEENRAVGSYFLRLPLCWGWATWDRAWTAFKKDIKVMQCFDDSMISKFTFDGTYRDYWAQLEANRDGKIDTWFIFWYATIFLREALALFPRTSLVRNIGMDGTGVHCGKTNVFDVEIGSEPIRLNPLALEESSEAFARHKRYFRSLWPAIHVRMLRKAKRIVRGWLT